MPKKKRNRKKNKQMAQKAMKKVQETGAALIAEVAPTQPDTDAPDKEGINELEGNLAKAGKKVVNAAQKLTDKIAEAKEEIFPQSDLDPRTGYQEASPPQIFKPASAKDGDLIKGSMSMDITAQNDTQSKPSFDKGSKTSQKPVQRSRTAAREEETNITLDGGKARKVKPPQKDIGITAPSKITKEGSQHESARQNVGVAVRDDTQSRTDISPLTPRKDDVSLNSKTSLRVNENSVKTKQGTNEDASDELDLLDPESRSRIRTAEDRATGIFHETDIKTKANVTADSDGSSPVILVRESEATDINLIDRTPRDRKGAGRLIDPLSVDGKTEVTSVTVSEKRNVRKKGVDPDVGNKDIRVKEVGQSVRTRNNGNANSAKPEDNTVIKSKGDAVNTIDNAPKTAELAGAAQKAQDAAAVGEVAEGVSAAATGGVSGVVKKVGGQIKDAAVTAMRRFSKEGSSAMSNDQSGVMGTIGIGGYLISILNMFFLPFLFVIIIIAAVAGVLTSASNQNLSEYVIAWMPQISEACERHGIPEYTALVAAVMMQESGGNAELVDGDVMQCAEGIGYPVGTPVSPEESIDFGVRLIADLLSRAGVTSPTDLDRIKLALQAYNYGSGYISYALARDGGYTEENAIAFSDQQAAALGWSGYGDKRYVEHVLRYYTVSSGTGIGGSSSRYPTIMYPMGTLQWTTYTGHEGIDIPCNVGTPIYASASGTVTYTKNNWVSADGISGLASYGNCVFINHSSGLQTRYAHMQYTVVQSGQSVFQGQLIGYSGNTGNSTGPHLHFSIYDGGSPGGGGYQNNAALAFPDMRMY